MHSKTTCPRARILIYALGGGLGHLTRSVALARAVGGRAQVQILTNSAFASRVNGAELVRLNPDMGIDESRAAAVRSVNAIQPDCLVVDTFPRGLGGELAPLLEQFQGRKVLVARDLNPRYVQACELPRFIERAYDLVLDCERVPWLVRSSDEVLPRHRAREVLQLKSDLPCVLVNGTGTPRESQWYDAVAAALNACEVRRVDSWPALELYAAADVVVGGAGYNTVNECAACGVPLVARPWPRKYDRQELRAEKANRTVREIADAVAAACELAQLRSSECRVIRYENGAVAAADQVLHLLAGSRIL